MPAQYGDLAPLVSRCQFPPAGTELSCAVSGGPDSVALLALAAAAGCCATAFHVDHGLRPGSSTEAAVVAAAAEAVGASFCSRRADVEPGPNLEARARAARFAVLPPGVATGHTADDQAETVLLNLLRGAGIDGLAGMRRGPRHPILGLRRFETRALCDRLELDVVSDPSNDDPAHLRNRVRHELVPKLCELAGRDVVEVLGRQADLLAEEADLLDALAAEVDPTRAAGVAGAPLALGRRALRRWLRGDGEHPPGAAAVERVIEVARGERRACEVGAGLRVARSGGRMRLERPDGS